MSNDISDRWYPRDMHEPPPYPAGSLEWDEPEDEEDDDEI